MALNPKWVCLTIGLIMIISSIGVLYLTPILTALAIGIFLVVWARITKY